MAEQIRGPIPPDYHYERIVNGQIVETWVPSAMPNLSGLTTTGIRDDGAPAAPVIRQLDPVSVGGESVIPADPARLGMVPDAPPSETSPEYAYRADSKAPDLASTGYAMRPGFDLAGAEPQAAALGFPEMPTGPMPAMDTADSMANVPAYQNGTMNPRVSGVPLTPGGKWNMGEEGGDGGYQEQVTQPDTGATAGPFGTSVPNRQGYYGEASGGYKFNESGHPYEGGNGGQTRAIISAVRSRLMAKGNAMESKVRGMASNALGGGGGGTSSSGGYSGSSYDPRQAKRQSRRTDRAYEKYQDELYNPDPLPVHGWSKKVGYKPGSVEAAIGNPDMILADVFPGYESTGTFGDRFMESIPFSDIAMAAAGTTKKGLTQKTPEVKVPGILKQAGVEPPELEKNERRVVNPSKVVNTMAGLMGGITEETPGGGQWFDTEALLDNLANAKKKSAVRTQMDLLAEDDPAAAMRQAEDLVANVLSTRIATPANIASMRLLPAAAANLGGDILRRKPKKMNRYVTDLAGAFTRS